MATLAAEDFYFYGFTSIGIGPIDVEFTDGIISNFGPGAETWLGPCIKSHKRPCLFIYFASVAKTKRY